MDRLLERGAELELLGELVGGPGRAVFMCGEAGIGKTSVVRALREQVAGRVGFFLGACEPLSVPVPLGPLRELLEAAGGGELDGSDRLALARTVHDALAERAPAVAVVEDVHWADPTTLDVIRLLLRRLEGSRVSLIVTYRDDEVAANSELSRLLGDVVTNPAATRILLHPLSEQAVRQLAGPAGVDPANLLRLTGGNPFLVTELINAQERPPATVRDAALARAGRLSAAAREVVDAAAVLGQRFEPALLEAVAPSSETAVEEALGRGVMVADGSVLGFRHELIREALESSIPPPRRVQLHARVAAALETTGDHARLAHHAELAGLADEACRHATLAAAEAERLTAMWEASLQLRRALRTGTRLSPGERFELLLRYARSSNFASLRLEDALEAAQEAVGLSAGDLVRRGRAQMMLAYALWSLDRVVEAKEATEQAIAALEKTPDIAELARAHATGVRIEASALDPTAAIAAGPRALELAEAADLDEVRIDVTISVGLARGHRGDRAGLALLERACLSAREAGLAIPTVRSYVNQVVVGALLREHAFVDRVAREALEILDKFQTTIPRNAIELFVGRSLLDRGRWDESLLIASRTDRDRAAENPSASTIVGIVKARRGEPDGVALVTKGWEELRSVTESSRHAFARVALVEAAWLCGEVRLAREYAHDAIGSPAIRFARPAAELALWGFRLGLEVGLPTNAPEPVRLELEGDWRGAVRAWHALEAPYDAALAALPGDERAARDALATLKRLDARAAIKAFSRERSALGERSLRGPRRSTLFNPAGLTRREQEVLEQLATGATNAAIAAALCVSERTVAHHVSAILSKLGAANRLAAVQQARARGVLAEDGQRGRQT